MFELDVSGRVAVVSGAANGIGRGVALGLASAGAAVVALDRDADALATLATEFSDSGWTVCTQVVDVADAEQVRAAVELGAQRLGPATILVTAAAVDESVPLQDMTLAQWHRMIEVNLHGTFHCLTAAVPGMRAAGGGSIVLFGSNIALKGGQDIAHYGAAKGAVHALARCAAIDLAPFGITVNVVAPGPVQTGMLGALSEQWLADKRASMPLRRFGEVSEIVPTVVLLASSAGAFYTGSTLNVSGGDVLQ